MTTDKQMIFAAFMGAVALACVQLAVEDFRAMAEQNEAQTCKDEPDSKAYMARLPGEAHTVEHCIHAIRYGSPSWVPDFQSPLKPRQEK